ncbi:MAG: inorganic phosphate transporter [Stenotrophobium sp.]
MSVWIALGCALLLTYANGANDNFKGVATLFGSGTSDYRRALLWGTVTTFAGAIAALWLSSAMVAAFSGKLFIAQQVLAMPGFPLAVCAGAAATVLLATRFGLPVSTTHALIGALCGAAVVVSTGGGVAWDKVGKSVFLPLVISPLLAILLAMPLYPILRWSRQRLGITKQSCVCAGQEVVGGLDGTAVTFASISTGQQAQCEERYAGRLIGISADSMIDSLHYLSAGAVGFARGLNDTPKLVGLGLLCMPTLHGAPSFIMIAVIMAAGGLLSGGRVARTLSQKITRMNAGQGLTANLVTSTLVILASPLALPVSTTHVSVGALFGIGSVTGQARGKMIAGIVLAWVLTLPLAAAIGGGMMLAARVLVH